MTETTIQRELMTALFPDLKSARDAVQKLRQRGVNDDYISLLASGKVYEEKTYRDVDSFYLEDGEVNIAEVARDGAIVGGAGGFLFGLGTITVPGAGPLLIVGTALLSSLSGLAVGGATAGAVATMIDIGLPEKEVENYQVALDAGKTLVAVRYPSERRESFRAAFDNLNPLVLHEPQSSIGD